jgi:restriction system protein
MRVAYVPESGQLVIEYQLINIDAIPPETAYKYVKKTDKIEPVARKTTDIRKLYRDSVAQMSCRVLRVIFSADVAKAVDVVAFNGYVDTIDPGTGKRITPTLVSVRTSMSELAEIDFSKVDAIACLAALKALVSRNAHELEPVRPIVNFNMVDPRFIDKTDVLSELDSRPNIAELSPSEFESLMTNLFEKMGLETRLTQASRDGGVDCVAWDMRPVIGGKVVIQAKRYKNTVGVSAVRDLFGTMLNEGAAKGILVTTSGFGASAYEFAKNKPIELITGSNLLSVLSEYASITAKIEFPREWEDKGNVGEVGSV